MKEKKSNKKTLDLEQTKQIKKGLLTINFTAKTNKEISMDIYDKLALKILGAQQQNEESEGEVLLSDDQNEQQIQKPQYQQQIDEVQQQNLRASRIERRKAYKKNLKNQQKTINQFDPDSKTIFVGNLNQNVDKFILNEMFAQFGEIVGCRILKDENGKSRGVGFVDFSNSTDAQNALKKNEEVINGRKIKVDISVRKNKKTIFEQNTQ